MTTKNMYLENMDLFEVDATVEEVGEEGGGTWLRLDRTIFHAQGGGQKPDRGTIDEAAVTHVAHGPAGAGLHFVDSAATLGVGDRVHLLVDPEFRFESARYHSAGHLIAALIETSFPGLRARSGHHWPGEARVEFDGMIPSPSEVEERLLGGLSQAVASGARVQVEGDPYEARTIRIGPGEPVPCGGTHVTTLSQLAGVHVQRVRKKSGRLRVSYGF